MTNRILAACLFGAVAVTAVSTAWAAETQPSPYFPLQVGNQWVLQSGTAGQPQLLNIEVLRSSVRSNGEVYYLVSGFAQEQRWIRTLGDGQLVALNETSGSDELLAQLTPSAAGYRTMLSGCEQTAALDARNTSYRGPNYRLDNVLNFQYASQSCFDIGFGNEAYASGVGLVQRSITTIRGGETFDLIYAKVNGSAVLGKSKEIVLNYDFNTGSKGWLAGFSDYTLGIADLQTVAELRALPSEVNGNGAASAFYLQSMNRSDDVFMFLKKRLTSEDGLESGAAYRVFFDIRLSSNAQSGCSGVGGSPGDSVYLKAGASTSEPVTTVEGPSNHQYVALLADKGQQAAGGKDAGLIGTIANGVPCQDTGASPAPYVKIRKSYAHATKSTADEFGNLWLLAGTDSGFEGLTGLYYESITVRINPAVDPATSTGQR